MGGDFRYRLAGEGIALRLEGCDREAVASGRLARLTEFQGVTGASWHPAALAAALGAGPADAYGAQLRDLSLRGARPETVMRAVLAHDGRLICDALMTAGERTRGRDGYGSLPLVPCRPEGSEALLAEARALHWAVDRPNLLVSFPVLPGRAGAVADCLAEGIGVDASLVLTSRVCQEVLEAFLTGLERAREQGRDVSAIGAAVTFPLGLLSEGVRAGLPGAGGGEPSPPGAAALGHAAALALARFGYRKYERMLAHPRWKSLAADGARPPRLVWSACYSLPSGVPAVGRAGLADIVGVGTAFAWDHEGLAAFLAEERLGPENLSGEHIEALAQAALLDGFGVRLEKLAHRLGGEQTEALAASWERLMAAIPGKM